MERNQDTIIFTADEQKEFGVQPVVPVMSALKTADVFCEIAHRLNTKIETPADSHDYEQIVEWRNAEIRAMRLRSVAGQIMMLCPTEVIDIVLQNAQNRKR